MKKSEIKIGGVYVAKVASNITTVRVDTISVQPNPAFGTASERTVYNVTNLKTGRKTVFKSAAKFRSEVKQEPVSTPQELDRCPKCGVCGDRCDFHGRSNEQYDMICPKCWENMQPKTSGLASKIEEQIFPVRDANWLDSVAGYTPTDEQKAILTLADEMQRSTAEGRVMVVAAGAGTGKTSTLKMLEEVLVGLGQYTAFNASLVAESRTKFKKAMCNTTHSLAFKQVGKLYSHRLGNNRARIRSEQVAQMLGIKSIELAVKDTDTGEMKVKTLTGGFLASQLMRAISKFCQSAERTVEPRHFKYIPGIDTEVVNGGHSRANNDAVIQYLMPFAATAWADLASVDGKLPFTHDVYVKVWQLGTGSNKPYIPAAYILLDEAQDTAPVLLDILKQQTHALVILVGDDNQQIYEWRGAVNAMAAFQGAPRLLLSQSFRFGQTIADVANSILAGLTTPTDLVMKGFLKIPSRVQAFEHPHCILCRTNATAVSLFLRALEERKRPFIIGGSSETVEFCKAAIELQANRPTRHAELSCFSSWTEVQAFVKTDEGEDLKLAVKLVDEFGAQKIITALEQMPEEKDADIVLTTAHRSKGREWRVVKLAQDFPPANRMSDADRRLLYVAATRAQHIIDISECSPFRGGKERGIEVKYTIPMPSLDELDAFAFSAPKVEAPAAVEHRPAQPQKTAPVQVVATDGWVPNPDKPRDTEFTWTKMGEKYVIRGPQGHENQTVTVRRRNGTTASVRLGAAIQKTAVDVWMYAV